MKLVNRRNVGAAIAAVGIFLGLSGLAISPAAGAPKDSGTVNIVGEEGGNGNQPHVGCEFAVEFVGYPEGSVADLTFFAQPPTGSQGVLLVLEGEDIGGDPEPLVVTFDQFDATQFTSTHENGYSVKLDVAVDGAKGGPDSKTFWVSCSEEPEVEEPETEEPDVEAPETEEPETEEPATEEPETEEPETEEPETEEPEIEEPEIEEPETEEPETEEPEVEGSSTERPTVVTPSAPGPDVLPNVVTKQAQPTVAGVTTLPRTGSDSLSLAQVGFGLVLIGGAIVLLGRSEAATA